MAADSNVAPVIIKRKKVIQAGGHHGGAWKVAYADFVTAMMAFFMLMWLLNATTEKQRKGIADYFSPTIAISRVSGGGDGALGGDTVFSENTLTHMGRGATSLNPTSGNRASGAAATGEDQAGAAETEVFEAIEGMLQGRSGESLVGDNLLQHIVTRVTDEGLVIELYETDNAPLFEKDGTPTALLERLSDIIVDVSDLVTNGLAIEGHVSAFPVVLAQNPAWEVSAARANTMRELVIAAGLAAERINRVTAHADREHSVQEPFNRRNNRLEVIFLRDL